MLPIFLVILLDVRYYNWEPVTCCRIPSSLKEKAVDNRIATDREQSDCVFNGYIH